MKDLAAINDLARYLLAQLDAAEQRENAKVVVDPGAECPCGSGDQVEEIHQDGVIVEWLFAPCGHIMAPADFAATFGRRAPDEFALADIRAKRTLITEVWDVGAGEPTERVDTDSAGLVLRRLSFPYIGWPGYRPEWAPEPSRAPARG